MTVEVSSHVAEQYNAQALIATQQIFGTIKANKATLKRILPQTDSVITIAVNTINVQNQQERIEVAALRFDNRPEKGDALGVSVCLYKYQDRVITQVNPEEGALVPSNRPGTIIEQDGGELQVQTKPWDFRPDETQAGQLHKFDASTKVPNAMQAANAISQLFSDGIPIPQTENVLFYHFAAITNDNHRLERVFYSKEQIQAVNPNKKAYVLQRSDLKTRPMEAQVDEFTYVSGVDHYNLIGIDAVVPRDGKFNQLYGYYQEMISLAQGKMVPSEIQKRIAKGKGEAEMLPLVQSPEAPTAVIPHEKQLPMGYPASKHDEHVMFLKWWDECLQKAERYGKDILFYKIQGARRDSFSTLFNDIFSIATQYQCDITKAITLMNLIVQKSKRQGKGLEVELTSKLLHIISTNKEIECNTPELVKKLLEWGASIPQTSLSETIVITKHYLNGIDWDNPIQGVSVYQVGWMQDIVCTLTAFGMSYDTHNEQFNNRGVNDWLQRGATVGKEIHCNTQIMGRNIVYGCVLRFFGINSQLSTGLTTIICDYTSFAPKFPKNLVELLRGY